jgi:hypothetical protein
MQFFRLYTELGVFIYYLHKLNEAGVGISHKAVLLQETAKPALFRATTNILSSDRRLANQRGD